MRMIIKIADTTAVASSGCQRAAGQYQCSCAAGNGGSGAVVRAVDVHRAVALDGERCAFGQADALVQGERRAVGQRECHVAAHGDGIAVGQAALGHGEGACRPCGGGVVKRGGRRHILHSLHALHLLGGAVVGSGDLRARHHILQHLVARHRGVARSDAPVSSILGPLGHAHGDGHGRKGAGDGDVAADGILLRITTHDMDSRRALEGTADGDGHSVPFGYVDAHLALAAAGDACAGEVATVANHRIGNKIKGLWQRSHAERGVHARLGEPAERHVVGCLSPCGAGSRRRYRQHGHKCL